MSIKVEFGKNVHKLPSDLHTLEDILKSIHIIFKDRLPKYFALKYKDAENDLVTIQNN